MTNDRTQDADQRERIARVLDQLQAIERRFEKNEEASERRHNAVLKQISQLSAVIRGSGEGPGLVGAVRVLQLQLESMEARWRWVLGIVATIIAAVIIGWVVGGD